jgi:hypothetical protein
MAATMSITTQTITTSTREKPVSRFLFALLINCSWHLKSAVFHPTNLFAGIY